MQKSAVLFWLALSVSVLFSGCGTLESFVDTEVERVGTELMDVPVSVDEVNFKTARGLGEIKGFRVHNPAGYSDSFALSWDLVHLNLDIISTIVGEPIVLDRLVISYPVVNLEKNEQGGSNLRDLADTAKKNVKRGDEESKDQQDAGEEPVRLIIRELVIEGVTLNVRTVDGTIRSAMLPPISLTSIGGTDGTTPGGLGVVIIEAMAGEMLKQAIARELIERAGNSEEALSIDTILDVFDDRLGLSLAQREAIRPFLEDFRTAVLATIDIWVEQGFVDLGAVSTQFAPFVVDIKTHLEPILVEKQNQELDELLSNLQDNGVEIIRFIILQRLAERLDMTPGQVRELRPILHEHLVTIGSILKDVTENENWSLEYFLAVYDNREGELCSRLAEKLSSEQMKILKLSLDQLRNRIQTIIQGYL